MHLALITVLADEVGQVQIHRCEQHTDFLVRHTAGAGVRRLADVYFRGCPR